METVAELVRHHRRKAGLTQPGLATLAGVSRSVIWDVENGKQTVQWDTLQKIFRVLNITLHFSSPILDRETHAATPKPPS